MEEDERRALCGRLETADASLFFLLLILLSVLLSFWAVRVQRGRLCLTIRGGTGEAASAAGVFPIRWAAGALAVGALGFFLCLAVRGAEEAERGGDPAAVRSARVNLWASILVLSAAVLRLEDLDFTEAAGRAVPAAERDLPA